MGKPFKFVNPPTAASGTVRLGFLVEVWKTKLMCYVDMEKSIVDELGKGWSKQVQEAVTTYVAALEKRLSVSDKQEPADDLDHKLSLQEECIDAVVNDLESADTASEALSGITLCWQKGDKEGAGFCDELERSIASDVAAIHHYYSMPEYEDDDDSSATNAAFEKRITELLQDEAKKATAPPEESKLILARSGSLAHMALISCDSQAWLEERFMEWLDAHPDVKFQQEAINWATALVVDPGKHGTPKDFLALERGTRNKIEDSIRLGLAPELKVKSYSDLDNMQKAYAYGSQDVISSVFYAKDTVPDEPRALRTIWQFDESNSAKGRDK